MCKTKENMYIRLLSPVAAAKNVLKQNPALLRLPINVKELCKRLAVEVEYVDFCEVEEETRLKISSALQKGEGEYIIFVNEEYSDEAARFSIAHELGHYYLHAKDDPRRIVASFLLDESPREKAADKFAMELLMPKGLLEKEYKKMVIPVARTLARKFNVSEQVMRVRLDRLGFMYI